MRGPVAVPTAAFLQALSELTPQFIPQPVEFLGFAEPKVLFR
jgi:hypothetical protein